MLVAKKHKKLILNLRDPERITTIIPAAKKLQWRGKNLVVVPHRLDEVRVLRNLGLDAPSPIESQYEWQGRKTPYIHQRVTASFLTMNPRSFVLNGMGCIAGDDTVRVSRYGKSYEIALRDLHRKFHSLPDKSAWKVRSLKGDRFGMHNLLDSMYKGDKATLRITLADGKTFRCTPDHRIARPDGSWSEAGTLRVGDALVTNGTVMLECPVCRELREVDKYYAKRAWDKPCRACKHKQHSARMSGENNPAFKGTPFVDNDGYVRVWMPDHHRADNSGRVYEHILVAEATYGGPITSEYHVHHKNGVKNDNRPENLEVLLASDHHREHDHWVKLDRAISAKGGLVVVLPKSSEIVGISDGGVVDVYDLSMETPHHNFVVNGVVVHNSGKTISVLWAFDFLRKVGAVRRMLVLAPLSTLERAWGDEIFSNFPDMTFAVLHGTRDKRHKLLAEPFDVYIINHDGIKSEETLKLLCEREDIDLIVVDEVASFRNVRTERWIAANRLINGEKKTGKGRREWAWGLTGTPTPNGPVDAFGQVKLINPGRVGGYFGQFRDSVMRQSGPYKWVMRDGALDIVRTAMQPAVRFAREDCIDLPPTTYVTRHCELTPAQKKAYDEMASKLKAEFEGGLITAANAATKTSKLLQICCGVAYGPNGDVELPIGPRFDLVMELIEESASKVIIFVPFTGALEALAKKVAETYSVAVVHGEVSKTKRDTIFKQFQVSPDPHVLIADPRTMSHGLTLTAASTTIWFGPAPNNETYLQANERTPRPGQKLQTLIVNIESTAVERKRYEQLRGQTATQNTFLELIRDLGR